MTKVASSGSKRILLVEDEQIICNICVRTLEEEGLQVDVAENGVVAQGKIAKADYGLVLIDIRTPLMNGKDLYEHIKTNLPKLADKVIFTTGDTLGEDTRSFLKGTGRPYLAKPFTPIELKKIVKKHFGARI